MSAIKLTQEETMEINYGKLPAHMQESARRYVEDGADVGGFLTALLSNNLLETYGKADSANIKAIPAWLAFLYWEAPSTCWGSVAKVKGWQKNGGLNGETTRREGRISSTIEGDINGNY